MAFNIETDFIEVGGPSNTNQGGQTYSIFSKDDNVRVMLVNGYLNDLADILNVGDSLIMSGKDQSITVAVRSISATGFVIVRFALGNSVTEAGAGGTPSIGISTYLTELIMTSATTFSMADGYPGQTKKIAVQSGTPDATIIPSNRIGFAQVVLADPGDTVTFTMGITAWYVTGNNGAAIT